MRTALLMAVLLGLLPRTGSAEVFWDVFVNDPTGEYRPYHAAIEEHVLAAGAAWSQFLVGDASLQIEVRFDNTLSMSGGSTTFPFLYVTVHRVKKFVKGRGMV